MDLQRDDKRVALSDLSIYWTCKNCSETINLKYPEQLEIKNSNYVMGFILYQVFKTILCTSSRRMKHWPINQQIIYTSTKFIIELK